MLRSCLLIGLLLATACRPKLDAEQPTLAIPASLPAFAKQPTSAGALQRATELADEATPALAKADLKRAIPLLTEALAADGSHERARWLLAEAFVRGGRGSVALQLLQPLKEHTSDCGWCVEFLQKVKQEKVFATFCETTAGRELLAGVTTEPMPYVQWAKRLATAIQTGNINEIARFAHITLPFTLLRSCPDCADPGKQQPQTRALTGPNLLVKVASRFDTSRPENPAIPLTTQGEPTCRARCCSWTVLRPVANGTAALERVCLRPNTPNAATLSEISLVYGAGMPPPAAPRP